jgi:hypothetical protein
MARGSKDVRAALKKCNIHQNIAGTKGQVKCQMPKCRKAVSEPVVVERLVPGEAWASRDTELSGCGVAEGVWVTVVPIVSLSPQRTARYIR